MIIMAKYQRPLCELEEHIITRALLAGSELTDDGAGDPLIPGDEFTF